MFLAHVNPNPSVLLAFQQTEVLFLVGWANLKVMEALRGELYPAAEDWVLPSVVWAVPGVEDEVVGLVEVQPPGACHLDPHRG